MPTRPDISTLVREVREVHDQNPAWTTDNAFVQWYLQAFLVPDPDLAARFVTGVSHDKGVDAIYIDDAVRKVFVVQGKFHQGRTAPAENRTDLMAFAQLGRTLFGTKEVFDGFIATTDPLVADRLKESRARLKRGYQLELHYVTTGRCSSAHKSDAEAEGRQSNGRVSVNVADRQAVLALLVDYMGGAAPPVPYLDLAIDPTGVVGSDGVIQRFDHGSKIESWMLTMVAKDVGRLYQAAGDRLFARNIRGFLGDTAINEGMVRTLKRHPDNFWYFNNGVTIVCSDARKTAERGRAILRVSNPQIINGQQTTRTLSANPSNKAAVLVRVISVPRDGTGGHDQFELLVSNIVAATNWQNAINNSDLRSNDARQIALQRELAKLNYFYIRKRQTKREAKRLFGSRRGFWVKKEELAQVVAACDEDPVTVRKGKEGLFTDPHYGRIYDGRSVWEYLSMFWLGRVVKAQGSGSYDRAYAKWLVMHFLWSELGSSLRQRRLAEEFRRMCERRNWSRELDRAADLAYMAALDFYRRQRGTGRGKLDVSNFFYRPHLHTAFATFMSRSGMRRRSRIRKHLRAFTAELDELANA